MDQSAWSPATSDDLLIARLYELTCARERGCSAADRQELVEVDALVYGRLNRTYAPATITPCGRLAAYRLDS